MRPPCSKPQPKDYYCWRDDGHEGPCAPEPKPLTDYEIAGYLLNIIVALARVQAINQDAWAKDVIRLNQVREGYETIDES